MVREAFSHFVLAWGIESDLYHLRKEKNKVRKTASSIARYFSERILALQQQKQNRLANQAVGVKWI